MTYQEALTYIHSVCWKGSVPGLSRTRELLGRIGNPQNKLKFVHIAGTNGKGSTAAMLASVFRSAGYRTGLYTSPFILCFNERMQVDGEMISDEELAEITEFVRPHAEAMADHPTEFELVTVIAMEYFMRHGCDIVSLEVGLGGELDSTNVISTPEAAVICNIGLDHTEVLGDTLEKIASAKAGIIKGGDVVIYRGSQSVERVFEDACKKTGARLHRADFDGICLKRADFSGQVFDLGARKPLELPLLGEHQLKNAAVVVAAVDALTAKGWRISEAQLRRGLKQVCWPGRFELLRREPVFFVDGGHNPQCMAALAKNLEQYLSGRRLIALTGVMADKDYFDMYRLMEPYFSAFVTVTPDNPRALPAQELAKMLERFGKPVSACASVEEGVRTAISMASGSDAVVAFGSLYMVGDIRTAAMKK